jgi:hypothetical protein
MFSSSVIVFISFFLSLSISFFLMNVSRTNVRRLKQRKWRLGRVTGLGESRFLYIYYYFLLAVTRNRFLSQIG